MQIALLFIYLLGIINPANGAEKQTKTAFENAVKKLALKDAQAQITLKTTDARGSSILRNITVSFGDFEKTRKVMIQITGPEDLKGTQVLTTHFIDKSRKSTIEIFLPSTGKIRKFRANNRKLKIPGTEIPMNHFSSAAFDDYLISEEEKDNFNGREVQKIKLQLPGNAEYLVAYLDVQAELLYRINSFDNKGNLTSDTEFTDYRHPEFYTSENHFPYKVHVYNPTSGKTSELTITKLSQLTQIRDSDFDLDKNLQP
jgi:hypothetical protein